MRHGDLCRKHLKNLLFYKWCIFLQVSLYGTFYYVVKVSRLKEIWYITLHAENAHISVPPKKPPSWFIVENKMCILLLLTTTFWYKIHSDKSCKNAWCPLIRDFHFRYPETKTFHSRRTVYDPISQQLYRQKKSCYCNTNRAISKHHRSFFFVHHLQASHRSRYIRRKIINGTMGVTTHQGSVRWEVLPCTNDLQATCDYN